ncbi:MAG: protoporphyrinogen oxidase [Bacteroidia bacterium]|nr:protoporphyrinogen oxidase [Bacteroidia bacterium]
MPEKNIEIQKDILIIGAGITGLSTAVGLIKRGFSVAVLEKSNRIGGQIRTFHENGFVFESGANTGSGASNEVVELFNELHPDCEIEFARKEAERRLIWKNGRFHALPSGLWSGITTPLFTFSDKIRILGESWRTKGTNPNESVADLTVRRLGKSFLNYAIDPFLSGIYAGDAETLITRHALPKLYNLEQNYGSFIGGAIKKAKDNKKTDSKNQQKRGIFSTKGGMENFPRAMAKRVGLENIFLSCNNVSVQPDSETGIWKTTTVKNGKTLSLKSKHVVTTVGAYALPTILPFVEETAMQQITNLRYAPVTQVAVGVKNREGLNFNAFGGLISSKDNEDFLGILFPSACFSGRCPEDGMLFSFFMGGMKRRELTELNDEEITEKVIRAFHRMLGFLPQKTPDLIQIFRHKYAIPQYELSSEQRFKAILDLEKHYPGLHIAGNLRDGIGMAHRIIQGTNLASEIK